MVEVQDSTADTASHHSVRSTIVWTLVAIMIIAVGLLLSPIPVAGNSHNGNTHVSTTDTSDTDKLNPFIQQEPLGFDDSVLNDSNLQPARNPAPMAIAVYD